MLIYLKKRFRNYGFWVSLVSAVLLLLTQIGVQVDNTYIMNIIKAALGIGIVLGIFNDPTTNNQGFGDDLAKNI